MNEQVRNNRDFPSPEVFREEIHRFFSDTLPLIAGTQAGCINDNVRMLKNASSR